MEVFLLLLLRYFWIGGNIAQNDSRAEKRNAAEMNGGKPRRPFHFFLSFFLSSSFFFAHLVLRLISPETTAKKVGAEEVYRNVISEIHFARKSSLVTSLQFANKKEKS